MKTLLLIDANSLIHRCFHALPPFTNPKGEPVGALFGISNILLKIISDKKPDYAVACFDRPEPTFRKKMFSDYKAQRPKAPDELVSQIIGAHKLFESFSVKFAEIPGYEADDIIGSLAKKSEEIKDIKTIILTGDLDSLQLVKDGKIIVDTFKKGISETIVYDEEKVKERYGIKSDQLIDYKALVGDASDNIPGVFGIGPKAATFILQKYETLENFLKNGVKEKYYEKIKEQEKTALLSRQLAEIDQNAPIDFNLNNFIFAPNKDKMLEYFKENDFSSSIKRLEKNFFQESKSDDNFKKEEKIEIIKNVQTEIFKKENLILITEQSIKSLSLEDLNSKKEKIGYDLKLFFKEINFARPIFDIAIALKLLGMDFGDWQDASLKLFKQNLPQDDFLLKSYNWLVGKIKEKGLEKIMYQIEMPLLPTIAKMESNGILIDKKVLEKTEKELKEALKISQDELSKIIGKDINPNSPKQLLDYFKNTLNLKINSTSAEAIEKAEEKNNLPVFGALVLYREIFKLKTTYVDAFKKLIASDGRIHPTFLQLGAATGRLSCQNPNLQNIPQESQWSQKIRSIFVAPSGKELVSFDYSQIELRVLASLTGDKQMIETFKSGGDIHTTTAEKIFGVSKEQVTKQMRRLAKTLNFGMVYGMGPRAFAQGAKISLKEAQDFIKKYFEQFPSIKEWEKRILSEARREGVSKNINGRFRDVSQINSVNQRFSSEAERMAKNMPSQSLAADILKLAMIGADEYIKDKEAKMILSIHDELIFEVDGSLINKKGESRFIQDIKSIMENSFELKVPLQVEIKTGENWGNMNSY